MQISLFPSLDLVAEDVGIAKSGAAATSEMATAKSLRFGLQLSALIGGKVKMTEVTLIDPVIAVPQTQTADKSAEDAAPPQADPGSAAASLRSLSLDKLLIKNGTLILPGSAGAPGKRIEALKLEASMPAPDATLAFDGSASLDGQKIQVVGSIGGLAQLLDGKAVPVSLRHRCSVLSRGEGRSDRHRQLQGGRLRRQPIHRTCRRQIPGRQRQLQRQSAHTPPADPECKRQQLGGIGGGRSVGRDSRHQRRVHRPNAQPRCIAGAAGGAAPSAASGSGSSGGGETGWSDARIDFSGLKAVTAKLKLTAAQLVYNNIKIGNATLQATISGGKLSASLPSFQLYGGAGTAALDVDASGKIAAQRIRLTLANFDAYPFLKDSAGVESLEGTGAIALDVAGSGASQRAIVAALSGSGKFEFSNGAIRGINIAKTMRGLTTGILSGWQENAAEKTDFVTFGASFKIAKGQAQTADLRLAGPLVRMTGAGTVDLPGKTLKFRVDPQLVASPEGQGGKTDLQGLGVPIMIAGPWAKPSIYPDIEGILQDPAAAYEQLNRLGGGLVSLPGAGATGSVSAIGGLIKNGKVGTDALQQGALGGIGALLGGQGQPSTDEAEAPAPQPATKVKPKPKPVSDAAPSETKKSKKRQAAAEPTAAPQEAANQLLQNFLGN